MSYQDAAAFVRATYERKDAANLDVAAVLSLPRRLTPSECADILAGLVARGTLEILIAMSMRADSGFIYHEKIGVFSDTEGNTVAFTGSANESAAAYEGNFERVDVFPSFKSDVDRRRAAQIEQHFAELWQNQTPGVEVIPLHCALQRRLLRVRQTNNENIVDDPGATQLPVDLASRIAPEALVPPQDKPLRKHQNAAIQNWAAAGGRGIFEMATGSGKTITALSLAGRLYDGIGRGLVVLIVAPLVHLVDQWCDVAASFGLRPVRCAGARDEWYEELSTGVAAVNAASRPLLSAAVTATTLGSEAFQRIIRSVRKPMLIIGDEAHNYGAPATLAALPENATYRVGLSATPDRAYDDEGTDQLKRYFGPVVFTYGLKEALHDGVLTPYRYLPQVVELDSDEVDAYAELTLQIGRFGALQPANVESDTVKHLLIKRARLVGAASGKLPLLRRLLAADPHQTHTLVYCGDGTVAGPVAATVSRQVDEVARLLNQDLGIRANTYTAETPPDERARLLSAFASGEVQALVAIRCLDEGVDVPATRRAYILASTTNPRQSVQRRGRVLRRESGKSRAEIYDFFVTFPAERFSRGEPLFDMARGLLRTQLARAREFADLAENGPVARDRLLKLRDHFDLLAEG